MFSLLIFSRSFEYECDGDWLVPLQDETFRANDVRYGISTRYTHLYAFGAIGDNVRGVYLSTDRFGITSETANAIRRGNGKSRRKSGTVFVGYKHFVLNKAKNLGLYAKGGFRRGDRVLGFAFLGDDSKAVCPYPNYALTATGKVSMRPDRWTKVPLMFSSATADKAYRVVGLEVDCSKVYAARLGCEGVPYRPGIVNPEAFGLSLGYFYPNRVVDTGFMFANPNAVFAEVVGVRGTCELTFTLKVKA